MTSELLVALVTGGLSFLGVVITSLSANKRMQSEIEKQQAVMDTKLESLTREVRAHNNFARRMPVVEEGIKVANHRIKDIERKLEK